jgi:2-polyprenyl-3-methyl-5-hydroxy-6-metoxy-1,4-benzoquinol methylase
MAAVAHALELAAVPCPLCDAPDVTPRAWLRDVSLGVPGEFALARCDVCGLWQQNPRVRDAELERTYPDDYPRHTGDPELPKLMRDAGPGVRRVLATRLGYRHLAVDDDGKGLRVSARLSTRRIVENFPPWTGKGRLLDVGCATGKFLRLMTTVGWQVAGIEIDSAAAAKARSVTPDVFEGDPVDAPFQPESFDVITSFHVVEHLPQPRAALRRMLEWLTPGGLMIVEVPNFAGTGGVLFGRYWSGLDFPRHLVHFTPATMTAMVERAGGHIVEVRHRTKPRWLIRSLRHWLRDQPTPLARAAGAALDSRVGGGVVKLGLEIVLPAARRAGFGEMAQYVIRRG